MGRKRRLKRLRLSSEVLGPVDVYHTALDRFQILVTQIGLEVRTFDVKILKSLVVGKIPSQVLNQIDHKEQYSSLDLFTTLQEYGLLSINNLSLLKEVLVTANRPDLAERVEEFEKTVTDRLDDAPQSQMNNLPAPNMELLYLVFPGQNKTMTIDKIEHIKQSICGALDIKISEVFYITDSHCDPGCTRLVLQIPATNKNLRQLEWDAINKKPWLTELDVIELKVGMRAVIPLGERQVQEKTSAHGVDSALGDRMDAAEMPQLDSEAVDKALQKAFKGLDKTIPPEILARGPRALKAYNEALENGKTKNQHVLVTVVGPARAGKTSLLRTLKGEKYNPEEDSTVGVQLQQAFCKPKESSWCEEDGNKGVSYKKCMAKTMAENLSTQTIEEEPVVEIAATNNQSQLPKSGENQQHHEHTVQRPNEELTSQNKTEQKPENVLENSELPKEIKDELIIHMYLKNTNTERMDENEISFKTLDFAGQSVYNVIHPLFMSPKAIYILVHSLENDLLDQVQSKVKQCNSERELENEFEMTNLDILEFWLSCVSLYTKLDEDSVGETEITLPPVYVVCTHADLCKPVPKQVTEKLYKSLTRPENPCGKHVVPSIYTVDNTLSGNKKINDESAKKLKADIEEKAKSLPQMNEDIPLTWLWFEDELSKLVQNEQKKYIDLEEATRIANKCKINTESNEFTTLLNYLHDLKTIIYFQETGKVFIDTQWLVNMFVKVITVMPFGEWKDFSDSWRKLEDEGVLQRDLVEHVWRDIVDDRQSTVDSLLVIMEKFSLICRWKLNENEVYLVPSMVCHGNVRRNNMEMLLKDPKSSTMAVCFDSVHLPLGIFPRLFVAIAEYGKKKWPKTLQPKLRPNFCRMFNVGEEERFDICITSDIRAIFVTVYNKNNVVGQKVTLFCQSVRKLLDHIFKDMRHNFPWMQNMKFEYGIRCPICIKSSIKCRDHKTKGCTRDSCLHFVKEEELKQDRPECYQDELSVDNFIKEETYSHWFPKEDVQAGHLEKKSADNRPEIGVCQELVACVGVQDLRTICPTKAATKVADILQLDKSSVKDPPAGVRQKCRAFCMHLKKEGRPDIIRELRTKLPSGMTGPLPDEEMLYQELEFITRRDLTRALCGNDLWKGLASELAVPGDHIEYYERQRNPAKAVLDDQSNNTFDVGKLYDLLVQCDAGALADKYL